MSIQASEIESIARLARIRVSDGDIPEVTGRINDILNMIDTLQAVNTDNIAPMANPLDACQRLREDVVNEADQREQFQAIAPDADNGLYLVPKVIE